MLFDGLLRNKAFIRQLIALRDMRRDYKQVLLFMVDVVIVVVAFVSVILLENASGNAQAGVAAHLGALASLVSVAAVGSWALGLPKVQLKFYEARGMARSAGLGGLLGITAWGLNVFIGYDINRVWPSLACQSVS